MANHKYRVGDVVVLFEQPGEWTVERVDDDKQAPYWCYQGEKMPEGYADQRVFRMCNDEDILCKYKPPAVAPGYAPPVAEERGKGLKFDAGKPQARLVITGFPHTLTALVDVLTMGAQKYSADSWQHVENGIERYSDAAVRHMLARLRGEEKDAESGLDHEAHELINRLFVYELKLRERHANA